jgi:hypothetical protein
MLSRTESGSFATIITTTLKRLATAEAMETGFANPRWLAKNGRANDLFKFKTLNDFSAGSAFVVSTFKMTDTKVSSACLVEIEYESANGIKVNAALMVSDQFKEQCDTKLSCLLYYGGRKDIGGGKKCHQLLFKDPKSELLDKDDGDNSDADTVALDNDTSCEDCVKNNQDFFWILLEMRRSSASQRKTMRL